LSSGSKLNFIGLCKPRSQSQSHVGGRRNESTRTICLLFWILLGIIYDINILHNRNNHLSQDR
jgi:hypothetical protein